MSRVVKSIKRLLFDFCVNIIASSHLVVTGLRFRILKMSGIRVRTSDIRSKCYFNSPHIAINEGTFVNNFCKFFASEDGTITIGKNCFVAMGVLFTTITHRVGDSKKRAGENEYLPIIVGDGCWIGANATILPGVTIGEGCIVAAGSVVNKDCKANGLYAGVPAKRIKELLN